MLTFCHESSDDTDTSDVLEAVTFLSLISQNNTYVFPSFDCMSDVMSVVSRYLEGYKISGTLPAGDVAADKIPGQRGLSLPERFCSSGTLMYVIHKLCVGRVCSPPALFIVEAEYLSVLQHLPAVLSI